MGVPGAVHLADHVGGLVRSRAVDRERHRATGCRHPVGRRDAGAEPAVRLRAVRHAGSGVEEEAHFLLVDVDEVGEPDIGPEPVMLGDPVDRALAVGR
jgi:hypothetical protein